MKVGLTKVKTRGIITNRTNYVSTNCLSGPLPSSKHLSHFTSPSIQDFQLNCPRVRNKTQVWKRMYIIFSLGKKMGGKNNYLLKYFTVSHRAERFSLALEGHFKITTTSIIAAAAQHTLPCNSQLFINNPIALYRYDETSVRLSFFLSFSFTFLVLMKWLVSN